LSSFQLFQGNQTYTIQSNNLLITETSHEIDFLMGANLSKNEIKFTKKRTQDHINETV
jgi:hypothetical protein